MTRQTSYTEDQAPVTDSQVVEGKMAEVVLIHGIGTADGPPDLVGQWLGALCAGAPHSLMDSIAERTSMASYQDWSWASTRGAQGPDDVAVDGLPLEVAESMELLAVAWLEAAAGAADEEMAEAAAIQLAELRSAGGRPGAQGPMAVVRSAIAALSKVPLFGRATYGVVQKINRTNLWQVTAYVNNIETAKDSVLDRVAQVVSDETRIVVAHSLGTVVAYEVIHRLELQLDLLLTIGSPLGLDNVIYPKLEPAAAFPPGVQRWVNVADPDDFIAADPSLADRFPDHAGGRSIEDIKVRNCGPFVRHHHITEYLSQDKLRAVFWEALDG